MDTRSRWGLHTIIGITTALRRKETLTATAASFKNAGFNKLHLFADKGSIISREAQFIKITHRESIFGAWKNWFYALKELREAYDQEYYGIAQDDILLSKNINQYLYYNTPREADCFSIFCPSIYVGLSRWNRQDHMGSKLWMAQTFFFTKAAVDSLLTSQEVWRISGDRHIDNRVGLWAKYNDRSVYYHTPSLGQHVGYASTLWEDKIEGGRAASDFVGEDFDTLKLLD